MFSFSSVWFGQSPRNGLAPDPNVAHFSLRATAYCVENESRKNAQKAQRLLAQESAENFHSEAAKATEAD
jgi:hypothetical protein